MRVKKNDTVVILTGKDNGKTGKVLRALPSDNKVVVDGINIQKKHRKARSAQETSRIVEIAGPIDASNVLVVCPECGKATRVSYTMDGDKKVRICKKCGKSLDVKVEAKAATKKTAAKKTAAKGTAKKATAKAAPKKKTTAEEA